MRTPISQLYQLTKHFRYYRPLICKYDGTSVIIISLSLSAGFTMMNYRDCDITLITRAFHLLRNYHDYDVTQAQVYLRTTGKRGTFRASCIPMLGSNSHCGLASVACQQCYRTHRIFSYHDHACNC